MKPFPGTVLIDGNPLPRAPEWQGNFTLTCSTPVGAGDFYALTDWDYRSTYNMFLYEAREYKAKPLLQGGLRAGTNGATVNTTWRLMRGISRTGSRWSARSISIT